MLSISPNAHSPFSQSTTHKIYNRNRPLLCYSPNLHPLRLPITHLAINMQLNSKPSTILLAVLAIATGANALAISTGANAQGCGQYFLKNEPDCEMVCSPAGGTCVIANKDAPSFLCEC